MTDKVKALFERWDRMAKGITLLEKHSEMTGEKCRNISFAHGRDCAGCLLLTKTKFCKIWRFYKKLCYEAHEMFDDLSDEEKKECESWTQD